MAEEAEKRVTVEQILGLVRELDSGKKLKLISKIAEDLSVKTVPKRPKIPIASYGFCGMWKDRADMSNAAEWVRKLREQEERRSYHE